MTVKQAKVFYGEKLAGVLRRKDSGYEFVYDPAYLATQDAMPISLGLPLRAEKYESKEFFPFFDGLLPEGWLLELTCQIAKIDENDKFGLLMHTGSDPVGAVSVRPVEEPNE